MTYSAALHLHTWRCKHALGDVEDYAAQAVAGGCPVIGMADHAPFPDGRWCDVRMDQSQLDAYAAAVRQARVRFPQVRVLLGLECEDVPEFRPWIADELLGRIGCDYLVGSCHYIREPGGWSSSFVGLDQPQRLRAYADACVGMIESGLFAFIAHPDLFGLSNPRWTQDCAAAAHDICAAAAACGIPLEINANGLRKEWMDARPPYPWQPFWEIAAEHGVMVVLSSDAHQPEDTLVGFEPLDALRRQLGLVEASLPSIGLAC